MLTCANPEPLGTAMAEDRLADLTQDAVQREPAAAQRCGRDNRAGVSDRGRLPWPARRGWVGGWQFCKPARRSSAAARFGPAPNEHRAVSNLRLATATPKRPNWPVTRTGAGAMSVCGRRVGERGGDMGEEPIMGACRCCDRSGRLRSARVIVDRCVSASSPQRYPGSAAVSESPRRTLGRGIVGVLMVAMLTVAGCTSGDLPNQGHSLPPASGLSQPPPVSSASPPQTPGPADNTPPKDAPPRRVRLRAEHSQLTPSGLGWAVDSTTAINAASLANVHGFYRTTHNPVAWGRYLLGPYGLHRAEIRFAADHHIALYLLVPDADCSGCGGGDLCGNDHTAAQAHRDAARAITAARHLHLPPGVALFKDIEQVGACHGELTGTYLNAWYQQIQASRYRPAFYGNSTNQNFDFPRAYCHAIAHHAPLARHAILAQDEPEPAIGAAPDSVGPGNAPPFHPDQPACTPRGSIKIWQYGESLTTDNDTDIDEIRLNTPGLLAPTGTATT